MHGSLPNTDDLPLRFRGRQWYLRKCLPTGKRLEFGLGTNNKSEAARRARKIYHDVLNANHLTGWNARVTEGLEGKGWLRVLEANVRHRAKKKGGSVNLAVLEAIAHRCGGYCEVSGIPLETNGDRRMPFNASLDRIDSTRGYEADNLRMVALAVNLCMSHWGEAIFVRIAAATLSKRLQLMADGQVNAGEGFLMAKA
jgi:hypothetical protein